MRILMSLVLVLMLAAPLNAGQLPRSYYSQYASALKQLIDADHEMVLQMQLTARKLQQFYFACNKFPESEDERALFKNVLSKYILSNPYGPRTIDALTHSVISSPNAVSIYWITDPKLTQRDFMTLMKHPDPSWQGEPGTIFIVTSANIFLIWAAGSDRLPLKDWAVKDMPVRTICKVITPTQAAPPTDESTAEAGGRD